MPQKEKNNSIINKNKVVEDTKESEKIVNVVEMCKSFCDKYSNKDFNSYNIKNLKHICDEGNGLLNMYFITEKGEKIVPTIIQIQALVQSAHYILSSKQIEMYMEQNANITNKLRKTMHRATKLEEESKKKAKQINDVKGEQRSIIVTIISIVLAISIIPTAVAGIEHINSNFILPFLSSILLFGMAMIAFTYSLYVERIKKRIYVILGITAIVCIVFWWMSFNIDISVTPKNVAVQNNIESNEEQQEAQN